MTYVYVNKDFFGFISSGFIYGSGYTVTAQDAAHGSCRFTVIVNKL